MKIGGVILCRMDSTRLPGKTLLPIQDKPILEHIINRASSSKGLNGGLAVATTRREVDDQIVNFVLDRKLLNIYRGATEDIAGRALECSKKYKWDYFLRINADSPFITPELIDEACLLAHSGKYEFITNLQPRTFPYGVSIELIKTSFYESIYPEFKDSQDKEHLSLYLYKNIDRINYYNIERDTNLSRYKLVIDNDEDYDMLNKIISNYDGRFCDISYEEAIKIKNKLGVNN